MSGTNSGINNFPSQTTSWAIFTSQGMIRQLGYIHQNTAVMMSRTVRKYVFDTRAPFSSLPPVFLFRNRARYFNSTSQIIESPVENFSEPPLSSKTSPSSSPPSQRSKVPQIERLVYSAKPQPPPQAPNLDSVAWKPLDESTKLLLPMLLAQPSHFISAHIHGRPYLVTKGDILRLPFLMPNVAPGDILRLNRASSIGSRDYTLKGTPYIDERTFVCRATVMGTEAEPVRFKEKTTRRNRRVTTAVSKLKYTVLRISDLSVRSIEEIEEESGESVCVAA